MSAYERIADLTVTIESVERRRYTGATTSGFERVTTEFRLRGDGLIGRGEDVTYETDAHEAFHDAGDDLALAGEYALDGFSSAVGDADLFFGADPDQAAFRDYRRWAFESAALDLALKQANTDLASRLSRSYDPVRFVVSTRLGDPPTGDRVVEWLERDPELEFKLDPTSA